MVYDVSRSAVEDYVAISRKFRKIEIKPLVLRCMALTAELPKFPFVTKENFYHDCSFRYDQLEFL